MTLQWTAALLTTLLSLSVHAISDEALNPGSDIDDGGFTIYCQPSHANQYYGYNSLDFLYAKTNLSHLNLAPTLNLIQEDPSLSVDFYLDQIQVLLDRLKDKKPLLVREFEHFRKRIFKAAHEDRSQTLSYAWDKKKSDLNMIKKNYIETNLKISSFMRTRLPKDCKDPIAIQSIRREEEKLEINGKIFKKVTFHYDENLEMQFRHKPLQLSMLLVHEWLWEFFDDIVKLMRFNKALHSVEVLGLPTSQLHDYFAHMGFVYDACEENPKVGEACKGGAIYAGTFDGERYMVTPAGCSDSKTPTCDGLQDYVKKSWKGSRGKFRDIKQLTNILYHHQRTSPSERGDTTTHLITSHPSVSKDSAAHYCENMVYGGYDDWYLPSKSELTHIYCLADTPANANDYPEEAPDCTSFGGKKSILKGFSTGFYWSSTETNAKEAWDHEFADGGHANSDKSDKSFVRCVRNY